MQHEITLKLSPRDAARDDVINAKIAAASGCDPASISGFQILRKSIDARGKTVIITLTIKAWLDEPYPETFTPEFNFPAPGPNARRAVIIGAGPAGLFAALKLLEQGIKPILLERGKDVRSRRRDLAVLNREGVVNPESNYCFGEGGAGTYSDGKLYTRSTKRGDIRRVLNLFIFFGAPGAIASETHPHIGTNKLPQIIEAMNLAIIAAGGEIHFETKLADFTVFEGKVRAAISADGKEFYADDFILATGHSARDVFLLLHSKKIAIEAKPFAMGVRIEHPQTLINRIRYKCPPETCDFLPSASYSIVEQVNGRGVFSFCMCPGGIIAPAATDPGELVVNGWSPSKRNNPFANSGMVVQTEMPDALENVPSPSADDPLIFMKLQQQVEKQAYVAGGGHFRAPAQRLVDFMKNRISPDLPANSYLPGLTSADLRAVFPAYITDALNGAFRAIGKRMPGYITNEAVLTAPESRTSSPVRIPRHKETLQHIQFENLYPCGEGAGYAGGIVSAAIDGERVANAISEKYKR